MREWSPPETLLDQLRAAVEVVAATSQDQLAWCLNGSLPVDEIPSPSNRSHSHIAHALENQRSSMLGPTVASTTCTPISITCGLSNGQGCGGLKG